MSATFNLSIADPLVLSISNPVEVYFDGSKFRMNDDEYFHFCQLNRDLRIERTSEGDIIVLAPTGGRGGIQNAELLVAFGNWAKKDGGGRFFDSSTEFILPNRAGRAPDLSWVRNERWDSLTHITFIVEVEKRFGIKFRNAEIARLQCIGDLKRLVDKHQARPDRVSA